MKVNQQHHNRQPKGEIQREGRADAASAGPQGAGSERRSQRQPPQAAAKVKDANPGREFQGSGVLNKAGRYGSSTSPEQLTDQDSGDTGGGQQGKG